jgi:catechol 2,3-dioxygenase-like lactoylglutathione lyase family enzyme
MPKPIASDQQRPAPGDQCLDHVAHRVRDLDGASRLMKALGFTLTRRAGNSRRTMLKQGYIDLIGAHGPSILYLGTPDAKAERERLAAQGFDPLGLQKRPGYSLVRTTARPAPLIQYVEHHKPEQLWRPQYLKHENKVEALVAAWIAADDPVETGAQLARFAAILPRRAGPFVRLATARGDVLVGTREDCAALFGRAPEAVPALAGYALACRDPEKFARRCASAGLHVVQRGALSAVGLPDALGGACLFGTLDTLRDALAFPSDGKRL